MKINKKEISIVSELEPLNRYKYFVKRVADFEILYTIVDNDGRLAISQVENHKLVSFWSAHEFAKPYLIDEWKDYEVKQIAMEEFEESFIDLIVEEGYLINIFPVRNKAGFVVNINEFVRDLSEEYEKYT